MSHDFKAARKSVERLADNPACPACRRDAGWLTPDRAVLVPNERQKIDAQPTEGKGDGYPAFVMICAHCGFIRLHSLAFLERDARGS